MPGEETYHQHKLQERNPLERLQPGYETSQTFTHLFEAALGRALNEVENWCREEDDLQPVLIHLIEQCYHAGIPEEETVRQVMIHYYHQADEQTVRQTVRNLYQECKASENAPPCHPNKIPHCGWTNL